MTHAQKRDLVFQRKGRVHLNGGGRKFSRLLAAELCASTVVMVVMLDTSCSEVLSARLLATHSTRMFPLHYPCRASPCAVRFHLSFTSGRAIVGLIYCLLKAIRHIFHCHLPSKEPLVIGRKGRIRRSLSGTPGCRQTKDYNLTQANLPPETKINLLTHSTVQSPS